MNNFQVNSDGSFLYFEMNCESKKTEFGYSKAK